MSLADVFGRGVTLFTRTGLVAGGYRVGGARCGGGWYKGGYQGGGCTGVYQGGVPT